MTEVSPPLIPMSKDEFEHEVHVQLLRLGNQNSRTADIADKIARMLVDYLWHSGVRPMQTVLTERLENNRANLDGPGWVSSHDRGTPLFAKFAKEGPVSFTQPPASVMQEMLKRMG